MLKRKTNVFLQNITIAYNLRGCVYATIVFQFRLEINHSQCCEKSTLKL